MSDPASVLKFFGTSAGGRTLDRDEDGGNPFASALVEVLEADELDLGALADDLVSLTEKKSRGLQRPEAPGADLRAGHVGTRVIPEGSRLALVIVYSDYRQSGGASSLPGAARDAVRVSTALERAGFWTRAIVDPSSAEVEAVLAEFAALSAVVDTALFYTTGHGVQVGDDIYLLPGDYPLLEGTAALPEQAIRIADLSEYMQARLANLFFYAGCRDNPFK